MRINKYIAQSGLCSRRKADELVASRRVTVNGQVLESAGYDVAEGDVVRVDGALVKPEEEKVYIALHKPIGYVSSAKDEFDRPRIYDLITDLDKRLFSIGRLDFNTSGLLLLTNDGELAQRLSHPRHHVDKTYRARVRGYISDARLTALRRGVDIGGFVTSPAKVNMVKAGKNSTIVDITIHEGRYRQVRRMFKVVGNDVQTLHRLAVGKILLGRLTEGHYRKLTKEEIAYLKSL